MQRNVLSIATIFLAVILLSSFATAYEITYYEKTDNEHGVINVAAGHDCIWALTNTTLVRWNTVDSTYASFTLPEVFRGRCLPMITDIDGSVWNTYGQNEGQYNIVKFSDGEFNVYRIDDPMEFWIRDMACDNSGVMWFATNKGVYRFQNEKWERFGADDGLPSEEIASIDIDSGGTVWCGSLYGHLLSYDGMWHPHDIGLDTDYDVRRIVIDHDDKIWIVINKHSDRDSIVMNYRNGEYAIHTEEQNVPHDYIMSFVLDKNGAVWMKTSDDDGIRRFDGTVWSDEIAADACPPYGFGPFVFDENNVIWSGTIHGLFRIDGTESKRYFTSPLTDFHPEFVVVDHDNVKWFSCRYGLKKFDGETWTSYYGPDDFIWNDVRSMAVDNDNVLWIGGRGSTITFDGSRFDYVEELNGMRFTCIAVDHDNAKWLGNRSGGKVCRYEDGNIEIFDQYANTIAVDRYNVKWSGITSTVSRFDGMAWTRYSFKYDPPLYEFSLESIVFTPDNIFWGGDRDGFLRFDGETWTPYFTDKTRGFINMALDSDGIIWAACRKELVRFDGETIELFEGIPFTISNRYRSVNWVAVDHDNIKWLCSDDGAFALDTSDTGIDTHITAPAEISLGHARPNPFNAAATVPFTLASPGQITLSVYNITGQRVATIADGFFHAGAHTAVWDGTDEHGVAAASGVYIVRLRNGANTATRLMTMVK